MEVTGELYSAALALICRSRRINAPLVQRELRIGYNRAAAVLNRLYAARLVSAADAMGQRVTLAGHA